MKSAGSHRRDRSGNTLPAIDEDGAAYSFPVPPPVPTIPPSYSSSPQRSPDDNDNLYSAFSDTSSTAPVGGMGSDEKPIGGIRNRKQIAKRGGWKRLTLIIAIALLCLIGLIVGLAVGLTQRNKHNSDNTTSWASTSNSALNSTFPAGSWSIVTYLSSVSSSCSSNSATWSCYPYTTYNQSTTSSLAELNWIIYAFTSTSSSTPSYTISSTTNPFSFVFSNVSLSLINANTSNEAYTFSITMNKAVVPTAQLTSSNLATTCYYNQTTLEAVLYTQQDATWGGNVTGLSYTKWPYASSVQQITDAGSSVPDCIDIDGNEVGSFSVSSSSATCSCDYANSG